jgi:hypothetical protein
MNTREELIQAVDDFRAGLFTSWLKFLDLRNLMLKMSCLSMNKHVDSFGITAWLSTHYFYF